MTAVWDANIGYHPSSHLGKLAIKGAMAAMMVVIQLSENQTRMGSLLLLAHKSDSVVIPPWWILAVI